MKARRWGRWVGKWVCVVLSVWIGVLWLSRAYGSVFAYEAFWWSGGTTSVDIADGTLVCTWLPRGNVNSPGGPSFIDLASPRWPGWFACGVAPTTVPVHYLWIPLWAPLILALAGAVVLWRNVSGARAVK